MSPETLISNQGHQAERRRHRPIGSPVASGLSLGVDRIALIRNFVSVLVFCYLGLGVYHAWVYCVTVWPRLRWLSLKN
jgi:hypothetical protein